MISFSPRAQVLTNWRVLLWVVLSALLLIVFVISLRFIFDTPFSDLMRDPNAVSHKPFYVGLFSQLGMFIWAASTAICFFVAGYLHKTQHDKNLTKFFIASGFITLMLALDDGFMLHEAFFPEFLGISEKIVYLFYMLIIASYLLYFFSFIIKSDFILLVAAFAFFALSIVIDTVNALPINIYLIEDGFKMIGIISWLAFFTKTAFTTLTSSQRKEKVSIASTAYVFSVTQPNTNQFIGESNRYIQSPHHLQNQ